VFRGDKTMVCETLQVSITWACGRWLDIFTSFSVPLMVNDQNQAGVIMLQQGRNLPMFRVLCHRYYMPALAGLTARPLPESLLVVENTAARPRSCDVPTITASHRYPQAEPSTAQSTPIDNGSQLCNSFRLVLQGLDFYVRQHTRRSVNYMGWNGSQTNH
jgi:hypothetical protein